MKRKTIKSILAKKFNDWADSIEDENLRNLVKANSIITGGSIVSLLLNEQPNDFDIYLTDKKTVKAVCEYYCEKFNEKFNEKHGDRENKVGKSAKAWVLDGADVEAWKNGNILLTTFAHGYKTDTPFCEAGNADSDGLRVSRMITNTAPERIKIMVNSDGVAQDVDYIPPSDLPEMLDDMEELQENAAEQSTDSPRYRPLFLTTNAISLSNKIQIITRFYGNAEEIHKNFDYIHCTCYWKSGNGELVLPAEALESIINRQLIYRGSKYPFCSIVRSRKFIKRGWSIDAGQYLKMAFQLSELDLSNVDVLEDQLVGVDTLYFKGVISALQKLKDKDADFKLDGNYVTTIVDKVFG